MHFGSMMEFYYIMTINMYLPLMLPSTGW